MIPEQVLEQEQSVTAAEQLVASIPVGDPRRAASEQALQIAQDAYDDAVRLWGKPGQPVAWPQIDEMVVKQPVREEQFHEECGHQHFDTADCPEQGEDCGSRWCCEKYQIVL